MDERPASPAPNPSQHLLWLAPGAVLLVLAMLGIAQYRHGSAGASTGPEQAVDNTPFAEAAPEPPLPPPHLPTPEEVRGIYWTATTAGDARGQELITYMKARGLNTAVIDLKMDDGELAFVPRTEMLKEMMMERPAIPDLDALLEQLYDERIYRIARIAVMRDGAFAVARPELALKKQDGGYWLDSIGSKWTDPAAPEVREYGLALAREAYARGFDEIQFDYVRFPSDGKLNAISYPVWGSSTSSKVEVMQDFFNDVGGALTEEHIPVSFDLFGITFLSTSDFHIGQRLPDVYPNADFISPMTYPSHYPANFRGYTNPALEPYNVIKLTLDEGAKIMSNLYGIPEEESRVKFRPWIQDFDLGAVYTADRIEAEIKAVRDAGASGFLLWNARNVYEPANYAPPAGSTDIVP